MDIFNKIRTIGSIDVQQGLKTVAGNEMIYLKLLNKIIPFVEKSLDVLRAADVNEDLDTIVFEAHAIKGAMFNLGITQIGDMAKDLEMDAKSGQTDKVRKELGLFIEKLESFKEELRKTLE